MIIEKNNNKITTYDNSREVLANNDIYRIRTFDFLNIDGKYDRNSSIRKYFYTILGADIFSFSNDQKYSKLVVDTYEELTNLTNKKDLVKLYKKFRKKSLDSNDATIKQNYELLDNLYKEDNDIVLNEFVHKIINKRFTYFTYEYDKNQIFDAADKVLFNPDFDVLGYFDQQITNQQANNIKEIAEMRLILNIYQIKKMSDDNKHLCFDCPVNMCDCPKIMDEKKKTIDCYSFINKGIQVYNDETNELERFQVTDCEMLNKVKKKTIN